MTLGGKPLTTGRYVNEWHEFVCRRLLREFVVTDIDGYAGPPGQPLLVTNGAPYYVPVAIYEIRRGTAIAVDKWRLFDADRHTYGALLGLCRAAGIPLYVVYYAQGAPIDDDDDVHVFRLDEAWPKYRGRRELITADTFAERFPYPLPALERGTE